MNEVTTQPPSGRPAYGPATEDERLAFWDVVNALEPLDEAARASILRDAAARFEMDGAGVGVQATTNHLAALSRWIDDAPANVARDPEAVTWGRLSKVAEECGEVISAFIGATGQNPRKGVTHSLAHVRKELLDVAVTALGAVEHLDGNAGSAMAALDAHVAGLVRRAGLSSGSASEKSEGAA